MRGIDITWPPGHIVGFRLGNLCFGGRVLQIVDGRPTVETPSGDIIRADGMPEHEPFIYASWQQYCECGKNYGQHPPSGALFNGRQFMHRRCDGVLLKL